MEVGSRGWVTLLVVVLVLAALGVAGLALANRR